MASEKPKVTLYDFLYIDRERVRSLYAQLFGGLQTAIQQVELSSRTEKDAFEASAAKLISFGTDESKTISESRLENLDPHDLLLRDVLQGLAERGLIVGNVAAAKPGNIVLLSGRVTLLDFQTLRSIIEMLPDLLDMAKSGMPSNKVARQTEKQNEKNRSRMLSIIKKYVDAAPLGLQVLFETSEMSVWGTLTSSSLRESAGNLTIKHGPTLHEEWHMLAIVDVTGPVIAHNREAFPEMIRGLIQASDEMRSLIGRPSNQIGVTPLLIFRKLV